MKPYRGIIRIRCETPDICREKKLHMQPGCMACPDGVAEVIDLEGKVLHESRALAPSPAKKAKKTGTAKKTTAKDTKSNKAK